jgi:hypothetical protein
VRGSLAWVERPRFAAGGVVENRIDPLHSWTLAATSGFLWDSSLELAYSYNSGLLRQRNGVERSGGGALFFSWTKLL